MMKAIAAAITVLLIGITGAGFITALATILTNMVVMYLTDEAKARVKAKAMPNWAEWTSYGCALAAIILMICGMVYNQVIVLMVSGGMYLATAVFYKVGQSMKGE